LTKLLVISGSPTAESSTDLLLKAASDSIVEAMGDASPVEVSFIKLNSLQFIPCQACGKAPHEEWCVFHDDISPVLDQLAECDCLLVGTPIYFDSVSAQLKLLMDRCNCFRPADFDGVDPEHDFIRRIKSKRPGGMILVGGEQGWFEGARRAIAGFFIWIEVTNEGVVTYQSKDFHRVGEVADSPSTLDEARVLGKKLAAILIEKNAK
jgi:multimeric flavodoxin WrbA